MRFQPKILVLLLVFTVAAVCVASHAQLVPPTDDSIKTGGNEGMLGSQFLLDLKVTPEEAEHFNDALDVILEAYFEREFAEMQQLLNSLFMYDPGARKWELPRLLEAECYYFNGTDNPDLRIRYAKPIYRELMSLFPSSERNPEKLFRISSIMYEQTFYPEAVGRLGYLIESYPKSNIVLKARLALGKTYLAMENPDGAFDEFDKVYEDPKSTKTERFVAAAGMAVSRLESGFYDEAKGYFSLVISQPEDMNNLDQDTLFAYGDLQRVTGNKGMAKTAFFQLLERFPDTTFKAEVWYRLGEISFEQGDEEKSMTLFEKTLENFPGSQWAFEAEIRMGRMLTAKAPDVWNQRAAGYFKDVIKNLLFPDLSQEGQLALGKMLIDNEKFGEALAILEDLLVRPVTDERLLRGLDLIAVAFEKYVQRKFDEANYIAVCYVFKTYAQFVLNERMKTSVFDRITESFYQSLLFDSLYTVGISREAVRLFPNRAELARARAEAARGHYREAEIVYKELSKRDTGYVGSKAAMLSARMEFQQDNPVAAIEMADIALKRPQNNTDKAELLVIRSQAKLNLGDAVASIEGFRRAVDLLLPADKPRERTVLADALYGLAMSTYRSGRSDSAKSILEAALGAFPDDVRAGLAKVYLESIEKEPDSGGIETSPYWNEIAALIKTSEAWMESSQKRGAWEKP